MKNNVGSDWMRWDKLRVGVEINNFFFIFALRRYRRRLILSTTHQQAYSPFQK
jgi:hypothetical protein